MRLFACLTALAIAAPVYPATLPAAPAVTAGAGFKALRLDWHAAPRASWYEVWYRPRAGAAFQKLGADLPAAQTAAEFRISVHLFDWAGARYRVAACNSAGCASSPAVAVSAHRLYSVGYFKAPEPNYGYKLGEDVELSANAANFVASEPHSYEALETDSGLARVFRRGADGQWLERAPLLPALNVIGGGRGMRVSISADGNTVAMGLPNIADGEVNVFKSSGAAWVRTRITPAPGGGFGTWVSLNDAGNQLAIKGTGGVGIYQWRSGAWQLTHTVVNAAGRAENCVRGLLTRDGSTLVENCFEGGSAQSPTRTYLRVHSGPTLATRTEIDTAYVPGAGSRDFVFGVAASRNGDVVAVQGFSNGLNVKVYRRAAGEYALEETLRAGNWQEYLAEYSSFGAAIALSGDGRSLAIADDSDHGAGLGVQKPPLTFSEDIPGGVYVYQHGSTWSLKSVVKPNYAIGSEGNSVSTFGNDVAFCATGAALLVGHPYESSASRGIGGNWASASLSYAGAVWLY